MTTMLNHYNWQKIAQHSNKVSYRRFNYQYGDEIASEIVCGCKVGAWFKFIE